MSYVSVAYFPLCHITYKSNETLFSHVTIFNKANVTCHQSPCRPEFKKRPGETSYGDHRDLRYKTGKKRHYQGSIG